MTKPSKLAEMTAEELRELLAQKEAEEARTKEVEERKKAYFTNRDKQLHQLEKEALELHHKLKAYKEKCLALGTELYTEMMKVYDKEGEHPNTFTLENDLGTVKLEVERQERVAFNETIDVGIKAIQEVIGKLTRKKDSFTHHAIMDVLSKNQKGDFDPKLVAKLKKSGQYIKDETLKAEFEEGIKIIQDAVFVKDTAKYVRMYQRDPESEKFEVIQLQFSAL